MHLGGYVEGGDEATYYPDLWRWLVEERGVGSVLDVGCGEGHALKVFSDLGCLVGGIDGVEQQAAYIHTHDFTTGPYTAGLQGPWDLVWCCEFVEHVQEGYVPNFLSTFRLAPLVLMTHAEPGQQGYHHVNCRTADYWIGAMAAEGYTFDERLTSLTRTIAAFNTDPYNHYTRSGLAFQRNT